MTGNGGVVLTVPARPESLALVRQAAAGVADAIELPAPAIADLKTVVTEACMNSIVHAYPEGEGPLTVSLRPADDGLEVVIRDYGVGFRPRPIDPEDQTLRLGLPLIATLTDEFEVRGGPERGTEVRLRIGGRKDRPARAAPPEAAERTTAVAVASSDLVRPVLSRLIAAAASRADLSIDLLSNGILVGDVISAERASQFVDGDVGLKIEDGDGSVTLHVGPLVEGGAESIVRRLELPGSPGSSIGNLARDVRTSRESEGEYLIIEISERD